MQQLRRRRSSCGECGDDCGACCQRNFCFHPLRWIGSLFYAGTWCGPSCGNTYWGEGISDPPACHEPCNRGGQWTGRSGCASCNHGGDARRRRHVAGYPRARRSRTIRCWNPRRPQTPTKATRRLRPMTTSAKRAESSGGRETRGNVPRVSFRCANRRRTACPLRKVRLSVLTKSAPRSVPRRSTVDNILPAKRPTCRSRTARRPSARRFSG